VWTTGEGFDLSTRKGVPVAKPKLPALPFIRSSITQGLGASQAYDQYLATAKANAWRGMRKQDFLRLYSETVNVRESVRQNMHAPRKTVPSNIEKRGTISARGYGTWVGIHQRTSGESDYIFTPFLIKSNAPITPEEAEQRAIDYLDQDPDVYNRVLIGVGYLNTEHFIPGYQYEE
jgi:hypothetical protein